MHSSLTFYLDRLIRYVCSIKHSCAFKRFRKLMNDIDCHMLTCRRQLLQEEYKRLKNSVLAEGSYYLRIITFLKENNP